MNRKKRIKSILSGYFIDIKIEVIDNSNEHIGHHNFNGTEGTHFKIIMDDKLNISKSRLQTHRKINELLKEEFSQGMHALEIKIIN